jgi:hypothetical protein
LFPNIVELIISKNLIKPIPSFAAMVFNTVEDSRAKRRLAILAQNNFI